ncbi:MAG: fluoride efflux transporter CrcB [Gemmatimonadaceae bacterium]
MNVVLIFVGAGLGGVARYGVGHLLLRPGMSFPWPTLVVNVSGSLAITLLVGFMEARGLPPHWQAFLTIGLCGGYTTFSAFSYETMALIQSGHWERAAWYALASVVLCVIAAFIGLRLGTMLFRAA